MPRNEPPRPKSPSRLTQDEQALYEAVRAAQDAYLAAVRTALMEGRAAPLTAAWPHMNLWPDPNLWSSLVSRHVRPVFDRLFSRRAPDRPETREGLWQQVASHLAAWPNRLWDRVQSAFTQAQLDGESEEQLRARIDTALSAVTAEPDARQMAVTTTTATDAAARSAAAPDGAVLEWRSHHDERTREAHRAADGQRQPPGVPFQVGGEPLRFPGDPMGSAGNVINCRCGLRLVPTGDVVAAAAKEEDSMTTSSVTAAVTADTALPWAPRETAWDGSGAKGRVLAWSKGDPAKLKKAFVYQDPGANPRTESAYSLPVADVIGGKLQLVLKAVFAAAARLNQTHLPAGEVAKVRARLTSLYDDARRHFKDDTIQAPWKAETKASAAPDALLRQTATLTSSALTSAQEWRPRADWFVPHSGQRHGIRVNSEGRVSGYLATWDGEIGANCHVGMKDRCVAPPRSADGLYPYFHQNGSVLTLDDGTKIHPGLLTMDIGHGDPQVSQDSRIAHYDNSAAMAAAVIAGDDRNGIWIAGQVLPEVAADPARMNRLRLSRFSGHWEPIGTGMELIAATAVNVPGFPNPSRSGYRLAASAAPAVVLTAATVDRIAQLLDLPGTVQPVTLDQVHADEVAALFAAAERQHLEVVPCGQQCACQNEPVSVTEPTSAGEVVFDTSAEEDGELDEDTGHLVAAIVTAKDFEDPTEADIKTVAEVLGVDEDDDAALTAANWVSRAGGLPPFVKKVAKHLEEKGMDKSRAIATAINVVKKMCRNPADRLNWPGAQVKVNPKSIAQACKAFAQWEALKAKNAARKAA